MRKSIGLAVVASLSLFLCSQSVWAVNLYRVTNVGTLGGNSWGEALNNAGHVVGSSFTSGGDQHGFLWNGTTLTDLGSLGGKYTEAFDINDQGQVVGYSYLSGNATIRAFLYDNGAMTDLGTFGGQHSYAHAINNAGQIAGYAENASNQAHAFIYAGGSKTDLGTLGGTDSRGYGINGLGHVVGRSTLLGESYPVGHAFRWTTGPMTDLGVIGLSATAQAINDNGQTVGVYVLTPNNERAFLHQGTAWVDLGGLGGDHAKAFGINNVGDIVGYASIANTNFDWRACLFTGGQVIDLNTVLDSSGQGWALEYAYDINDAGQIVGTGKLNGQQRAFLLTPVPEPSTVLLLLAGGVGLFTVARRRGRRGRTGC